MRGFLQFGEEEFLEPKQSADRDIPISMETLGGEVLDAEQRSQYDQVAQVYARWAAMSGAAIAMRRAGDPRYMALDAGVARKRLMDHMRSRQPRSSHGPGGGADVVARGA